MSYAMLVFVCAACGWPASANPQLVLTIPCRWDTATRRYVADPGGSGEPVCRRCAVRALDRIRSGDPTLTSVAPAVREPGWLEAAYDEPWADLPEL